jgi:hypothetical protein
MNKTNEDNDLFWLFTKTTSRWVKIKHWFKDKWAWLLTFNKKPSVTIRADTMEYSGEGSMIEVHGRLELILTVEKIVKTDCNV